MNWHDLLAAFALYLVLEGLLPFLNPGAFGRIMAQVARLPESHLRRMGLISMLAGVALLYLVRS
jgi:uncharacterized protein YjeT (DUF2065 family)